MQSTSLHLRFALACATALIAMAIAAQPSLAAEGAPSTTLGTAEESPIAVPFTGTYEVWCTDRNPAPGGRCSSHHGSPAIDIGMDIGTPIHATGAGVVIETETECGPGYCRGGAGNFISIGHADGTFSRYLHLTDVLVQPGDDIVVGQPIGTSGITGQSSSAHLHYDEHFPAGTRTPMGPWIGCVNGEQVRYPDAFGETDWNNVPYGSLIVNDGFGCLDSVDVSNIAQPIVLDGPEQFGVVAPTNDPNSVFSVSMAQQDEQTPIIRALRGTTVVMFDIPEAPVALRLRELVDGVWQEWSDPVAYARTDSPGEPTERLACGGLYATTTSAIGTPTVDVMIGTDETDTLDGRGGDDRICGLGGDDMITAGPGRDLVWGGAGSDEISGGRGADLIWAEDGNDIVRGGDGPDTILGGSGDDHLMGSAGNDQVEGGAGDDTVIGGIGHDHLLGGPGGDQLEGRNGRDYLGGGLGDDSLSGGNGRDRLIGAGGTDHFNGGDGDDRCAPDTTGLEESLEGCER